MCGHSEYFIKQATASEKALAVCRRELSSYVDSYVVCVCVCVHVCLCVCGPYQCINIDVPAYLAWCNAQFSQVETLASAVGTLEQLAKVRAQLLSCSALKLRRGQG